MAVREQSQHAIAATEPALAWLRLLVVVATGMLLIVAGAALRPGATAWAVVLAGVAYAGGNSALGLYRKHRRLLTRRVYAVADLVLITLLVHLTGGGESPLHLLYALPLVVIVIQHGARAGAQYVLAAAALGGLVIYLDPSAGLHSWVSQTAVLGALWLVLGYVTHADTAPEERARRRDELGALHQAAAAAMRTADVPGVVEDTLRSAIGPTNCCVASIFLYDEEDDRFTSCYSLTAEDKDGQVQREDPRVRATDILYRVVYTNSFEQIADLQQDRRCRDSVLNRRQTRSVILAPLVAPDGRRVGILCLGRREARRVTQHEARFARTLALLAGVAIRTVILFEEAVSIKADKEADKLRAQLLASVSHELRTPIAAIQGFASSLRCADEVEIPPEMAQDWIAEIEANAERLRRLVTDLLDLSRMEAGALQMSLELQDLADVFADLQPNLERLVGDLGLIMQLEGRLPLVRCDAERIEQVLRNLVENAAKFSPPGSSIVVGAEQFGDSVRVGVLDTGEGIAPEFQEKIFERFYQVEDSPPRAQKGTGLGLAICRNIIEAHGGRIWVESTPGVGSIFYFTLPTSSSKGAG
jgi:signal transduction histidine kinase